MIKRILYPVTAFIATLGIHFLWLGLFPETDPAQSQWVFVPLERSWWDAYMESGSYWFGYSYALCIAFVVMAAHRYVLTRCRTTGRMAIGGLSLTGGLAVFGCFLIGCCGSPMLIVWINLFGARFLPLAKPLVAAVTTCSIAVAWFWIHRRSKQAHPVNQPGEHQI